MWALNVCPPLVLGFHRAPLYLAQFSNVNSTPESHCRNAKAQLQHGNCVSRAQASGGGGEQQVKKPELRTCRTCKQMYNPVENHPRACRYHSAHFGGETKRKFESVYTGGTLTTVGGGEITQYWHCCGVKDPFDPGCEAAPHLSYDD